MSTLKNLREKKTKNATQAAAVVGCSRQHLSRLEQGKALATPEQARAIRDYLGVPVLEVAHVARFGELQREIGLRPFEVESRISGAEIREGKVFELLLQRAAEQVRLQAEPAPRPPVRLLAPGRSTGWRPRAPLGPR